MIGEVSLGKIAAPAARFVTNKAFESFKNKRRNKIWEALSNGSFTVDSPELQNDEFIACYLATEEAIFKSTSQVKLNALIAMFYNGISSKKIFEQTDVYQEILLIVADLSERELVLLFWLYKFENKNGRPQKIIDHNVLKQLEFLSTNADMEIELIKALLIRLKRTGLLISENDMSEKRDLMMSGSDSLYLSKLANEVKDWIMFTVDYEGSNPLMIKNNSL